MPDSWDMSNRPITAWKEKEGESEGGEEGKRDGKGEKDREDERKKREKEPQIPKNNLGKPI